MKCQIQIQDRVLLAGAHAMDRHFATAPLAKRIPVTRTDPDGSHVDGIGDHPGQLVGQRRRLHQRRGLLRRAERHSS